MGLLNWLRTRHLKPGNICRVSGQYTYSQFPHDQRTCTKGEPLPPPPRGYEGGFWRLTDVTRTSHKG